MANIVDSDDEFVKHDKEKSDVFSLGITIIQLIEFKKISEFKNLKLNTQPDILKNILKSIENKFL